MGGRILLLLSLILALGACRSSEELAVADPRSGEAAPQQGPEPAAPDVLCSSLLASNADLVNVAFPDESAKYWFTQLPYAPGVRYRLEGGFPNARYFSFNTYDVQLRQVDSLADYQIDADPDSVNPYRNPAQTVGDAWGGRYTAYIVPASVPENRPANHLYSASTQLPVGGSLPNPQITILYRIYIAADGDTGEVGLPRIVAENAAGDTAILGLSPCTLLPDLPVTLGINEAIATANFPLDWMFPPLSTRFKPEYRKFYSLSNTIVRGSPLEGVLPPDTSGGFLGNRDNAYLGVRYFRDQGDLYIVRAKAPTWAGDPRAPNGPQLRYWSFCTNEFASQRFVACARDDQTTLDSEGYFTYVVSDPNDRPLNATPEHGITWLPWGGIYPDSSAIYRHMLPSSDFAQSVQSVSFGMSEAEVMGEYFPRTVYCKRETVESVGPDARAIFDACVAAYVPPVPIVP